MNDNAILILSCDKYSDLWEPFFKCFFQFWPDCPYKIYLGSNTVIYRRYGIETIYSGRDIDWSTTTKKILSQITEKYIWIFLEDTFLCDRIDNALIKEVFTFCLEENALHIHENQGIKPDYWYKSFGVYEKGCPYRVNVRGFWNKDFMMKLLIEGESPWNFEIMGSYRASFYDGFYCPPEDVLKFKNMVEKGKWVFKNVLWCKNNNIRLDLSKRPVQNIMDRLKSNLQISYFNLMLKVPWRLRVKLMNLIRKAIISY